MTDQSLARFTRPHEPDTTELVLANGERLPAHIVRRAMEALQVTTAYMQDANGSFLSIRPQPALAREAITEYLERLLNVEVPGRADPQSMPLSSFSGLTMQEIEHPKPRDVDRPLRAVADPTGVYSSPREALKPARRFDKDGAPY